MADSTRIEWCDATFNPWIGCTKVGPGCDHCYAEAHMDTRMGRAKWGAGQSRSRTSTTYWQTPIKWNGQNFQQCCDCGWRGSLDTAKADCCPDCGERDRLIAARRRVFCASLADVFDNEVDREWRDDLATLILNTPNLDWLLLTKRIGNAGAMLGEMFLDGPPANVWIGATVVNQAEADRDIPKLLRVPARVRFLSIEPMLGAIDLTSVRRFQGTVFSREYFDALRGTCWTDQSGVLNPDPSWSKPGRPFAEGERGVDWVIAGGESGGHARPSHPEWFRSLRDQCAAAGVPFLFKQWGEWKPIACGDGFTDSPFGYHVASGLGFAKVGKKLAGRLLDGVEHNGFPGVRHA